jgi:hypothetical protein
MFKNLVMIVPAEDPGYGGKCSRPSVDILRGACLPGVIAMIWGHHHKLVPCFIFAIGILQKSHNYKAWQKKLYIGEGAEVFPGSEIPELFQHLQSWWSVIFVKI